MKLEKAQKKVISNIFRDLTKLTVAALVIGQFIPGREFNLSGLTGGLVASILLGIVAVMSAVEDKEEKTDAN